MLSERAVDVLKKAEKARLDSWDCAELAARILNLVQLTDQDLNCFLDNLNEGNTNSFDEFYYGKPR